MREAQLPARIGGTEHAPRRTGIMESNGPVHELQPCRVDELEAAPRTVSETSGSTVA